MKFLHLSDLHYSPETDGRTSRKLRQTLPEKLKEYHIQADELLITGDYRHALLQKDMPMDEVAESSVKYIWKIAHAVGIVSSEHIHIIPGNHDRERDSDTTRAKKIQAAYSSDSGTFPPDDLQHLREQFTFFDIVCEKLYGPDHFWKNALHTYRCIGSTVFLYLNTAIMHNQDKDRGNLVIGNDKLDLLLEDIKHKYPDFPLIILAHHSPDMFTKHEKEAVEEILRSYPVKLYLCGDSHEVWWRQVNEYLEITMGCIKHTKGTEAAFLFGDTKANEYTAYHWVKAWEPYEYFNNELSRHLKKSFPGTLPSPLQKTAETEQERIQNEVLLPWMKDSVSYRAVFPKLFMEPELSSIKLRQPVSYGNLLEKYQQQHIVILGEAGAGKTTLLRILFLYQNISRQILYLRAACLNSAPEHLSDYENMVRNLLLGIEKAEEHKLILLDGIDEAYIQETSALDDLMKTIQTLKNVSVWFGWRAEHYYKQENTVTHRLVTDVIVLQPWSTDLAKKYITTYAEQIHQKQIVPDFEELFKNSEAVQEFTKSPFQLTLLAYLLENKDSSPEIRKYFESKDRTLFGLYHQFFECWLTKEHERATSTLSRETITQILWNIAGQLYYGNSCTVEEKDSAVVGLLTFSSLKSQKTAVGFYHRSFCAYFCADKIFHAILAGGAALIQELRTPLRNDVTDFVRSAISTITTEKKLAELQKHLMDAYTQAIYPSEKLLDDKARALISSSTDDEQFYLRNEILYLLTRIPARTDAVAELLEAADNFETNPYMKLDLAYGAALTGPSKIALNYAKSLVPHSESDLVNRSWTLAYFGDVQANPYEYRDIYNTTWEKSRNARLKRFQSCKKKAIRFRILDIPLMYCFYASRNWQDVNEGDFQILQNIDISCVDYTEDEKLFLQEQKQKLLQEYEKQLKAKIR